MDSRLKTAQKWFFPWEAEIDRGHSLTLWVVSQGKHESCRGKGTRKVNHLKSFYCFILSWWISLSLALFFFFPKKATSSFAIVIVLEFSLLLNWHLRSGQGLGLLTSETTSSTLRPSINTIILKERRGTSLEVQWLRLRPPSARGLGLIPGWGTKIPHTATKPACHN